MESASSAPICFIGELPDELLVSIVVQLRIECGFLAEQSIEEQRARRNAITVRSLHALVLTCSKFRAIATPFLYKNIIRSSKDLFMPLLSRTLFRKPSLCQHIQYFESETFDDSNTGYFLSDHQDYLERSAKVQWLGLQPLPGSRLDSSHREIATSGQDTTQRSDTQIVAGQRITAASSSQALIVLLSMMENLQDAALPDSRTVLCALTFATGRLQQIWLKTGDCSSSRPLHQKYAVRVISAEAEKGRRHLSHYLRRFCMLREDWLKLDPPPAMKEISLIVLDVDIADIDDHLEECASLERFSCRWQWTSSFVPYNTVDLPWFRKSLQRVCKTLTHLTIDTSESASLVELDRSIPPLGSLRDFEALRYLDVAGLVLWGDVDDLEPIPLSSLLPESLETLLIKVEWDDDIEDGLHELSFDCAVSLPNLKKIECTWRPVPRDTAEYLIKAFRMAAVDLVLEMEDA